MYSTCLFCHARLGANETIERFPVGRRLAYDAEKGRLWVVCVKCGRWNLTPLEERWEAIEDAERRYRATRLRVSTDNIGLARLKEGLELVRIGRPPRPEIAAWRYGREFRRRYWRRGVPVAVAGGSGMVAAWAAMAGFVAPVVAGGVFVAGMAGMIGLISSAGGAASRHLRLADGTTRKVATPLLLNARLAPADTPEGWALHLEYFPERVTLTGDDARRAAGVVLARLNGLGARREDIDTAVAFLDRAGSPDAYFSRLARLTPGKDDRLNSLPREAVLALEMATHDAAERRAMEGELQALAREWQVAEEIAAIADGLLSPGPAPARRDGRAGA